MKKFILFAVFCIAFLSSNILAQTTLVARGASWKYLDNGSNQNTSWTAPTFDDAAWATGNAQLGYGYGDETTVVSFGANANNKYITTYFRKSFTVANPADFSNLTLDILRDDGAVVYLNGTEVYRTNMPAGAIGYQTLASTAISGVGENTFLQTTISQSLLVAGNNVSYKRTAIEQISDDIKTNYWEYFLQVELRRMNVNFLAEPSIVVNHKKEFGFFYFLSQRFHYSRSFAAMRRQKSTVSQQIFYVLYAPIAPFHLTWRIIQNVLRKKRNQKELLLSFPMLFVFMIVYAFGEFVGQIFGSGNSLSKVE